MPGEHLVAHVTQRGAYEQLVEVEAKKQKVVELKPDYPFSEHESIDRKLGPITNMQFVESSYNFGTIKQNTENTYVFKFTNTGPEPLIIQNAKGSCGCTVPEYPTEPIPPYMSGEIKVVYKPGNQLGSQQKTITVVANTEPKESILFISAEVEKVTE